MMQPNELRKVVSLGGVHVAQGPGGGNYGSRSHRRSSRLGRLVTTNNQVAPLIGHLINPAGSFLSSGREAAMTPWRVRLRQAVVLVVLPCFALGRRALGQHPAAFRGLVTDKSTG